MTCTRFLPTTSCCRGVPFNAPRAEQSLAGHLQMVRMLLDVSLQSAGVEKALATVLALERPLARVDPPMGL